MKSIMSAVFCVALALVVTGCRYSDRTRFKHSPGVSDPAGQLKYHVSCVTGGKLKPYYEEWRNVKSNLQKPASSDQPYTATITAEVYEFGTATAKSPFARTDCEISLLFLNNKWGMTELKAHSGMIGSGAWRPKGAKESLPEGSPRWNLVARQLDLQ